MQAEAAFPNGPVLSYFDFSLEPTVVMSTGWQERVAEFLQLTRIEPICRSWGDPIFYAESCHHTGYFMDVNGDVQYFGRERADVLNFFLDPSSHPLIRFEVRPDGGWDAVEYREAPC